SFSRDWSSDVCSSDLHRLTTRLTERKDTMVTNEEAGQVRIAGELEERARMLAHSTRSVPVPSDSYFLLGELRATVDDLEQVCRQLGGVACRRRRRGGVRGRGRPR